MVEGNPSGIILETPDGRNRCDNTLVTLLGRLRAGREAEMEKILFEEGNEQVRRM